MFGFINNSQSRYLYQFFGNGGSTTDPTASTLGTNWVSWSKPNDMSFFWIYAVGGGGGGGGGVNGISSVTTRNGGGGGSSGALRTLLLPAYLVPDTLYISIGKGGAGVSNANGANGSATIVAVQPPSTSSNPPYFLFAAGGSAGRNSGLTGVTITEPTITATETLKYLGYSTILNAAGASGTSGGAGGANGSTWSPLPSQPIGGSGGGGANATVAGYGGNAPISQTAFSFTVSGGIPGAAGGGTAGNIMKNQYGYIFYPATGGAANVASAGSAGGRGAPGCGGGGGGGGAGSGIGGDGGDGFVIIGGW
jgi:hypothetical protein